ncbi:protein of unknown function [Beijerinckiaceae bacterium RH AL1]|jgi:hypothetical protein|nr:hypothetical protein [Beijerinckiaceae bacterium]VVB42217.1 protein of unknown function [Beijerinckiaceae bacterium RH AL8]VVB42218.1 protein of unknown function [Beijerinckiaceae bacterium RH CH11]VVC53197.1 protein of unknown function [Beijerinckiaceae bacterium RH AL1]
MSLDTDTPAKVLERGKALARGAVEERGVIAAMIVAFLGIAIIGPAWTRARTPRSRAQKIRDEAAFQAEAFRRRAQKSSRRARKSTRKVAKRLGGGTLERYF